jgi:hypothetical protein
MHLRVWWKEVKEEGFWRDSGETGNILSGIVVSGDHRYCLVRTDEGVLGGVDAFKFIKSEWISNPDDGELK